MVSRRQETANGSGLLWGLRVKSPAFPAVVQRRAVAHGIARSGHWEAQGGSEDHGSTELISAEPLQGQRRVGTG